MFNISILNIENIECGHISKSFTIDSTKKTSLKGYAHIFSVEFDIIDTKCF